MVSVQVSVSMPIEMVNEIDKEARSKEMSRAEYIRFLIRRANESPFDEQNGSGKEAADA